MHNLHIKWLKLRIMPEGEAWRLIHYHNKSFWNTFNGTLLVSNATLRRKCCYLLYRFLFALHLVCHQWTLGKHTPDPCHTCPDSPTFLHNSPRLSGHMPGSSCRCQSSHHPYTGVWGPCVDRSEYVHTMGSGGSAGCGPQGKGSLTLTLTPKRFPLPWASTSFTCCSCFDVGKPDFYKSVLG